MDASVIETLAALQAIDRRIKNKETELAELEKETGGQRSLLDAKEAEASTARDELSQVGTRRRELEAKLQDEEARMKERRIRSALCRCSLLLCSNTCVIRGTI
ncbi:MAG: hypothetical protein ACKO2K_08045 [Alphaproteobacteria bacterium]